MSTQEKSNNIDARDIIERFGGIRPMAKKLGVAVTTIQGWKKRNNIPDARMAQIQKTAAEHNINLADATNDNVTLSPDNPISRKKSKDVKTDAVKRDSGEEAKVEGSAPSVHEIKYVERQGVSGRATFIFLLVVVAFLVAGVMTMAPKVKVVSEQADRITRLESELKTVKKEQNLLTSVVPNDLKNKLRAIEQKAQNVTTRVQEVSQNAKNLTKIVGASSVEERIQIIEGQIGEYIEEKTSINLLSAWKNIQTLRGSKDGSVQLDATSEELLSWLNRLQNSEVTVDEVLPIISEESPIIGKTFKNVEKENLKAAAMLLAMSQMRDTLSRDNESFEQDLALLKKLVGEENPALNASIEKLAPHAQKGVLTPSGLSKEFKQLAGEVIVASISGEDVSISEKAKSRFGEIVVIKKDGEQITGTETQRTVADAQKLIDDGNIQGTIQLLQNLDGDALDVVKPFLKEAKLSLLASQVQELLGQNIQSKINVSSLLNARSLQPSNLKNLNIESVVDDIKEASPLGGTLYEDEESGFKIYKK